MAERFFKVLTQRSFYASHPLETLPPSQTVDPISGPTRNQRQRMAPILPRWPASYRYPNLATQILQVGLGLLGEFFGTNVLAATRRSFVDYQTAKAWAQSKTPRLTNRGEWQAMIKAGSESSVRTAPTGQLGGVLRTDQLKACYIKNGHASSLE